VRVAALYDVHGNAPALEAALAEVEREGVDLIVSGGDVVSGPEPAEALDLLESLGDRVRFIRGNADREVVEGEGDKNAWCRERLGPERATRVAAWPLTVSLDVDGLGPVRFCHATPRSDEEIVTRITPEAEVAQALAGTEESLVVCGHTHIQYDRRIGEQRLFCAGAVGWPYEGRSGAFWLLLGPDVSFRRTEYDVGRAVERVRAATGYADADEVAGYLLEPPDPDEASAFFESLRGA
jgi:predicted phosphodiesterase